MHELSIAEELLEIIGNNAEKAGIQKVLEVNLRIGDLAGILPESLEFAFQILSQGKITDGARLNIERIAPRFACCSCGNHLRGEEAACPRCGSDEIRILGGDQLEVLSFEGE